MKILYNVGRFNGGAPLSILQYAKIVKNNGNAVIAVGEYSTCEVEYNKAGVDITEISCFNFRRPIKNIIGFWQLYKIIKKEKPDIIHATSYGIVSSKFINKFTGITTLYSIAGGKNAGKNITEGIFTNEELIVYSQENKEDLIASGYSEKLITVISNRLEIDSEEITLKKYNVFKENIDNINILLISRLDSGVINSVNYVIDLIDELVEHHENIKLDIIGNGKLKNEIEQKAKIINKARGRNLVNVHGYTPNVKNFIDNAHLVFGKGRSIIESTLYNRISFIVGEDNTITKCSTKTVKHLYKFNFSGRNNKVLFSVEDLNILISKIKLNNIDITELEETNKMIDNLYNIKHAEKKILDVYQTVSNEALVNKKKGLIPAFVFLAVFYFKKIRGHISQVHDSV